MGTFKVCFCDSELLGKNEVCSKPEHFGVEVGVVHSTGISCLLEKQELRRVDCVEMMPSGVRCYDSGNLPSTKLPALAATDYDKGQAAADQGQGERPYGSTFDAM